jgi:hypothetical protein
MQLPIEAPTWSVAIFSSRETVETLASSIEAVLDASIHASAVVDVIINGNRRLAGEMEPLARSLEGRALRSSMVRFWYIALGDKAHAWNQYLAEIWPRSGLAYFVDGYARVMPTALRLINDGLMVEPYCLAASGVPTMGRSGKMLREKLLREGGIHGNLYAVRGEALGQLRERGFRLPVGLYRTDPLLGAVICFGLDPDKNRWDTKRILVHPQATWAFRPLAWRRREDVTGHLKRMFRQAQGMLENLAIRDHLEVKRRSPEALPRTVAELVRNWLVEFPWAARMTFLRHPLCLIAARRLARPQDRAQIEVPPLLLATSSRR